VSSSLYIERPSPVHKLHPLTKVVGVAAFFVAVFSLEQPLAIAPFLLALLIVIWLAGATANLLRLRALVVGIPVATFVIWTVAYRRGEVLLALGPLSITEPGLLFGLGMGLKLESFLCLSIALLSSTRVEELTIAFTQLGLPYRVGFTLTLAFRLVPVFVDTAVVVIQAQRLRSLEEEGGGLLERIRRTAPVIIPVFMGALRRADQMAMALEMRGFSLPGRRGGILRPRGTWRDVLALAIEIGALGAALAVHRAGMGLVAG
jgi:energy-coupling factor transport system permease protein